MTPPDARALFRILEATWPPAAIRESGGWTMRDGAGGGKRVSAATPGPAARVGDAPDLVQVRPWHAALDVDLAAHGYRVVDETVLYLSRVAALLALVMVLEGLFPFIAPNRWRHMLLQVSQSDPRLLRVIAGAVLISGLFLLQFLRH